MKSIVGFQTFYRAFERFTELTGERFAQLEAPSRRGELDRAGSPFLEEVAEHRQQFLDAMDDDFNTGGALGELFEIAHAVNRFANPLTAGPGAGPAGSLTEYRKGMIVLKELSGITSACFPGRSAAGCRERAAHPALDESVD